MLPICNHLLSTPASCANLLLRLPQRPMTPTPGKLIRASRLSRTLTTYQLSQKLGISRSYLTLIETSRRQLTIPLITPLAAALGLPKATVAEWYLGQQVSILTKALHLSPVDCNALRFRT